MNCVVCHVLCSPTAARPLMEIRTAASSGLVIFKLFDILAEEFFEGVLCQECSDIVDQVDCFQQNTLHAKDQLKDRYYIHGGNSIGTKNDNVAFEIVEKKLFGKRKQRRKKKRINFSSNPSAEESKCLQSIEVKQETKDTSTSGELMEEGPSQSEKHEAEGVKEETSERKNSSGHAEIVNDTADCTEATIEAAGGEASSGGGQATVAGEKAAEVSTTDKNNAELLLFVCDACGKDFREKANLNTHRVTHSVTFEFSDVIALLKDCLVDNEKYLRAKVNWKTGKVSADKKPWDRDGVAAHLEGLDRSNNRCELCSKTFCNRTEFRRHLLILHGGHSFTCPVCRKAWKSLRPFVLHIRDHLSTGAGEVVGGGMYQPARRQALETAVTCELCQRSSKSQCQHAKHMASVHGVSDILIACRRCGLTVAGPDALTAHRREAHAGTFACHLCGKILSSPRELKRHVTNIHGVGDDDGAADGEGEGEPPSEQFICDACPKVFNRKRMLESHAKVHSDIKIHECKICGKCFRWSSSLDSHFRSSHSTGLPLYRCDVCHKDFRDKSNLRSHSYTHSEQKPHSCGGCGHGFVRKDSLMSHSNSCPMAASAGRTDDDDAARPTDGTKCAGQDRNEFSYKE